MEQKSVMVPTKLEHKQNISVFQATQWLEILFLIVWKKIPQQIGMKISQSVSPFPSLKIIVSSTARKLSREMGNTVAVKFVWFIYIYIQIYQWMSQSDYPILGVEIARARKRFQHPLLTSKPATMTWSAQTTIPPYQL